MDVISRKPRLFEDHTIPTNGGETLFAKLMVPRPPRQTQRVVLIAPLVGAGAGQQLLLFREFSRRGAIVISYEYGGHPKSSGTFDLDRTIVDTHHALLWALNYANQRGLPLHGFATCYGTIPLLAQFKEGGCGHLLRSITTVSGLYHLYQILRIEDFAPIVSRHLGQELSTSAMVANIDDGTLDCNAPPFRQAFREYLLGLMPELRVELNSFEELDYDRVNLRQMLLQFYRADYFDGVSVPPWMPSTAVVGRGDKLFSAQTDDGLDNYRDRVMSIIPNATVHDLDMDHYGNGPEHGQMIECACAAFERADQSHVPPHHIKSSVSHNVKPRSLPR